MCVFMSDSALTYKTYMLRIIFNNMLRVHLRMLDSLLYEDTKRVFISYLSYIMM